MKDLLLGRRLQDMSMTRPTNITKEKDQERVYLKYSFEITGLVRGRLGRGRVW
jgi:hypothetical protein